MAYAPLRSKYLTRLKFLLQSGDDATDALVFIEAVTGGRRNRCVSKPVVTRRLNRKRHGANTCMGQQACFGSALNSITAEHVRQLLPADADGTSDGLFRRVHGSIKIRNGGCKGMDPKSLNVQHTQDTMKNIVN